MKQKSTLLEIIRQYFLSYDEIFRTKINYLILKFKTKNTFENYENMIKILKEEIDNYLKNVYLEMDVLNFILKNERNLFITDIYNILDMFDKNYEERFYFLQDILYNLETAIGMQLDYKFYIPVNRPKYLTIEDYEKYIIYVQGFNIKRVKEFLIGEEVYLENDLDKILNEAKILKINALENLDFFGVFENKLILPDVVDQVSSLINIHELVHIALLNKENIDEEIILGEDLPIFYELLFKKFNNFIVDDIHTTSKSLQLLKDYKYENFETQIMKIKKL